MKISFAFAMALFAAAFALIAADGNDHFVFRLACCMAVFGVLALNVPSRKKVKAEEEEKKRLTPSPAVLVRESVQGKKEREFIAGMRAESGRWAALAWQEKEPEFPLLSDEHLKMVRERLNAVRNTRAVILPPSTDLSSWDARRSQLPVETPLQKKVPLPDFTPPPTEFEGNGYALPAVEDSLKGYVPDGQPDLLLALAEHLMMQVREARKTPFTAGRKRRWVLSPEWAAEVRKLRDADGKPSWAGPGKFLRGYPVFTDKNAGVPELVAL